MVSFRCQDISMDCDFKITAKNKRELKKKIKEHADKVHNMKTISVDVMAKIDKAIKP